MPPKVILYNGLKYGKHPNQPYYYNSKSKPYRSLHRQMWYDKFGLIADGYDIHHKDNNAFNNELDNFELKEHILHISEHSKERDIESLRKLAAVGREYAKAWHSSTKGKAWHKKNAIENNQWNQPIGNANCELCSKEYLKKKSHSRFCSNKCKSAWRRKNKPDLINVVCPTCGMNYQTLKYLPKKYCSKKCAPAPNPLGFYARIS